jgi:hypothetical protein
MINQAYLFVQVAAIIVLLCVDGRTLLIQHPAWFQ